MKQRSDAVKQRKNTFFLEKKEKHRKLAVNMLYYLTIMDYEGGQAAKIQAAQGKKPWLHSLPSGAFRATEEP